MIPSLNYVVAAALLVAPASTEQQPAAPPCVRPDADAPLVRVALQQLALASELLDPREVEYLLSRGAEFDVDARTVRARYRDLAGAPPLCDFARFPNRELVGDMIVFNRDYRRHLTERLAIDRLDAASIRAALQETDGLYEIWDLVRDARSDYYYLTVRRQALADLRKKIGYHAYYAGGLPPVVPVWRFRRID